MLVVHILWSIYIYIYIYMHVYVHMRLRVYEYVHKDAYSNAHVVQASHSPTRWGCLVLVVHV